MKIRNDALTGFFEREYVRSGRIRREGFPDRGVIFSTLPPDRDQYDTSQFLGAFIENGRMPDTEPDRWFKILGGYFFDKDDLKTTHVFGVAQQPDFGITEGGSTLINNNWKLAPEFDDGRDRLNEARNRSGWTFIVEPKATIEEDVRLFPKSDYELHFYDACPEITHIEQVVKDRDECSKTVTFTARTVDGTPDAIEWDFGDGSAKQTTSSPVVSHDYEMPVLGPAQYQVSASIRAQGGCPGHSNFTTVDMPVCPCPEVVVVKHVINDKDECAKTVKFTAVTRGITPDKFEWDFGDGSPKEITNGPTASHDYDMQTKGPVTYSVEVSTIGPGKCLGKTNKASFVIPPCPCPDLIRINLALSDKDECTKTAKVNAVVAGRIPEKFEWEWGDGAPKEITSGPNASHDYEMLTGGPAKYTISVTAIGPQDCRDSVKATVAIPACPCPDVTMIKSVESDKDDFTKTFKFTAVVGDKMPEKYEWDFGDGSQKEVTTGPNVSHDYSRDASGPAKYTVTVRTIGPRDCPPDMITTTINIPAIECGDVSRVDHRFVDKNDCIRSYKLTAVINGLAPEKYEWDFGDGSPRETTTGPNATHDYEKQITGPAKYTVTVTAIGPQGCQDTNKATITVPACICPDITQIKQVVSDKTDTIKTATLTAVVAGVPPEKYEWDWGDGTKETTTAATATHDYEAPTGGPAKYTVSATAIGPKGCRDTNLTTVVIPAREECPPFCLFMPNLVAFFLSITLSCMLIYCVAEYFANVYDFAWVSTVMAVSTILAVLSIIFWYNNRPCPTPGVCDWYGIGWTVFLTGTFVSLYIERCCAPSWWSVIIGLILLSGVFVYLWLKKCAINTRTLLLNFFTIFLAAVISCFWIANSVLERCLR